MTAIIRLRTYKAEVPVKDRMIDGAGYVRIVSEDGTIYETHLSNVIFIGGNHGKE